MAKGSTNGKDPAVLWYFNDWQGGTMTFSRFLKGCYMDLLTAQFNSGPLSLDEIKTVLGSDFGPAWSALQKKFVINDKGLYVNERLLFEVVKRKGYTKSRRDNLLGSNEDFIPHMGNENEIESRKLEFENEVGKYAGEFSEKTISDFISYWTETNKSGTKLRYEGQKFFDYKKRLQTWQRNESKFSPEKPDKAEAILSAHQRQDQELREKYKHEFGNKG